ncbi:AUX/IAA protein [Parasponia andersonii]|uniref:Auxin-responsive protein n=1 Tax=Parasponia andersonii TaxID=3476 RepID=A0A2P5D3I4_PARAD|nr:AUX/IAA protein [Parasponia andersonii]
MAPQTYNLIPDDHDHHDQDHKADQWITRSRNKRSHGVSEDHNKKLELRLGPPGDQDQPFKLLSTKWSYGSLTFQCAGQTQKQEIEPKPSYSSAAPNSCHKRVSTSASTGPVVGWPPVRSFRKNVAKYSSFSKSAATNISHYDYSSEQKDQVAQDDHDLNAEGNNINSTDHHDDPIKPEDHHKFVKINMEGVPIGRKVDLNAYDSYDKLSCAIDQLFRGLLAAQRDYSASEPMEETEDAKAVTNGECTLVYEDNEGDTMLVGDVPWQMFVSTAKRLRVLKTAKLSTLKLSCSTTQIEKTPLDPTV